MFDFNASHNDVAPVSPILLSVDLMKNKRVEYMNNISALFQLCSLPKLNRMSVVFDFSASLNDIAPAFPIVFPVDLT